jgi:hypothetical protein
MKTEEGKEVNYSAQNNLLGSKDYYVGDFPKDYQNLTVYRYWQDYYYPYIIKESYPVYIQERALDKGTKAFEILKGLMDLKIVKLEKVSDFVEAMDKLIKLL